MESTDAGFLWACVLALPALLGAVLCTKGVAWLARRRLRSWPMVLRVVVFVPVGALLFCLLLSGGLYLAMRF